MSVESSITKVDSPGVLLADNITFSAGLLSLWPLVSPEFNSTWRKSQPTYRLLALHHQFVQLVELTDYSLPLRETSAIRSTHPVSSRASPTPCLAGRKLRGEPPKVRKKE